MTLSLCVYSEKTKHVIEMKTNESYSTVVRNSQSVSAAVSLQEDEEDEVMTEGNEAYSSILSSGVYEECDDFQPNPNISIATTENVAYGQGSRPAQSS